MKFVNEGLEKETIKSKLFEFVLDKLHEAFDNIALVASATVEGYDADWCSEELSDIDEDLLESALNRVANQEVDILLQNCPLNENLKEDFGSKLLLKKYTTVEIPYWCKYINEITDKLNDKEQQDLVFPFMDCEDSIQRTLRTVDSRAHLDECLFESVDGEALSGPSEGADYGFASMINTAIQDEFKTIELYNDISLQAKQEGIDTIVAVIDDINTEENKHVGQLQELLKTLSPNAEAIDQGAEEGAEQIADSE